MSKEIQTTQPGSERVFRIDATAIHRRHFNMALGLLLGIALCFIVLRGNTIDSNKFNDTLLFSVVVVIVLFGVVNLVGHIRYVLRSRQHYLEVGEDRITFVTGTDQSVLMLSEVSMAEPQSRLREGPSLMMRLRNQRIVRLVGYERQEALIEIVTRQIEASAGSDK